MSVNALRWALLVAFAGGVLLVVLSCFFVGEVFDGQRPNNAFKPKPLRSTKHMADKACHVFGSTTQFGLT